MLEIEAELQRLVSCPKIELSINDLAPEDRQALEENKAEIMRHLSDVIISSQKTIAALSKQEALINHYLFKNI